MRQSSVRVPPLETREEVVSGVDQTADDEFYGFQRLARLARSLGHVGLFREMSRKLRD